MTWRLVVWVLAAAMCFAVVPIGVAGADCSGAGDFGASSGCPPPGGSDSGGGDSWPPTSVDWPPGGDAGSDGVGSDASPSKTPAPIVLPLGQEAPPVTTSETPTPIVAVGAPPLP